MKKLFILSVLALLLVYKASAQITVPAKSAGKHVGKSVKVIDKVFDSKVDPVTKMTILYVGGAAPAPLLTVLIPEAYRGRFKGRPEVDFKGKDVTVTGMVVNYKGKPGIMIVDPNQLKSVLVDNAKNPSLPIK